MSISRRSVLASAAGLAFAGIAMRSEGWAADPSRSQVEGYGPLIADPKGVFDLPAGFSYQVISRAGETMSDGFLVPGKFDGMGCFALGGDQVALLRNHELKPGDANKGPFGKDGRLAAACNEGKAYDHLSDGRPLPGGVTTVVYDMRTRQTVSQHLSLVGTSTNCAGGITPWGSWLTCEENTARAGDGGAKDHGYVFEVPSAGRCLVDPRPLTALGRFRHEAACIDPRTGVVYLTEDEDDSLFYRMLPVDRADLSKGGRLQALALGEAGFDTRNWKGRDLPQGEWRNVRWIDMDGVDNPHDDLKDRGRALGAAIFARGEGVFFGKGELYFTCTSGGAIKAGQIMRYVPSEHEGQPDEARAPGRLQNFVESADTRVLDYADNIAIAPWGHLILCEDRYSLTKRNHLKGVTPDGKAYVIGRNVYDGNAELAGACFSPDGQTLFVNIYAPGLTLAVTGPWNSFKG
ncbi:alkaline phosphatase PhoX [Caulobacter sp. NIBR2454]|uniref:alkaline phosphatase PhoX n=1 Tax=Caulobacter sp. NIBR2454 TaxID=3015996 RepID=UPI0022B5EEC5|nr:alkaline phosphatase PhoX [Caulobacter sp. NIBR2454]